MTFIVLLTKLQYRINIWKKNLNKFLLWEKVITVWDVSSIIIFLLIWRNITCLIEIYFYLLTWKNQIWILVGWTYCIFQVLFYHMNSTGCGYWGPIFNSVQKIFIRLNYMSVWYILWPYVIFLYVTCLF